MNLYPLVKYYEVLAEEGKVTKPGWCSAKVSAALDISTDGELLGVIPLKKEEQRGKKTVEVPQMIKVPEQVTRSSGISPNFLCDNAGNMLGFDAKGNPERAKDCFKAAREMHLQILADVQSVEAKAVTAFFQKWSPDMAKQHEVTAAHYEELCDAPNLIFSVEGQYVQDSPEVKEAWEQYRSESSQEKDGICLVTGKRTKIARIHGKIKGVPGAQSVGASLIGFNESSFQSYEKEQSYNAPVGTYAMYAYTTALNYLIRMKNSKSQIGDTTVVYWSEDGDENYQAIYSGAMEPTADNCEIIDGVFKNLEKDWAVDTETVLSGISPEQRFYILGLSPNAARLAVRFYYEDSFGNLLRHLKEHYERMEIVRPSADNVEYLGVWRMLQEIVNKKSKDKKPHDNIAGAVYRAILSGGRYPESLYQAVIQRIRLEQDQPDAGIYKITRGRAAIIKAYLIRNTNLTEEEEITVGLNENSRNVPYTLGRIFAVLENIQEDANPGINATIKDRYFNAACATPAHVFPLLFKLKNSHTRKLAGKGNKGAEVNFEKLLCQLQGCIPVDDAQQFAYPKRLTLEEQRMFILGYYHQTQKRYEKKTKEEA